MDITLYKAVLSYDYDLIIRAIARLGTESITGMSVIYKDEVQDVLKICDTHELAEILAVLRK